MNSLTLICGLGGACIGGCGSEDGLLSIRRSCCCCSMSPVKGYFFSSNCQPKQQKCAIMNINYVANDDHAVYPNYAYTTDGDLNVQ